MKKDVLKLLKANGYFLDAQKTKHERWSDGKHWIYLSKGTKQDPRVFDTVKCQIKRNAEKEKNTLQKG